jgi:hypothetical protein
MMSDPKTTTQLAHFLKKYKFKNYKFNRWRPDVGWRLEVAPPSAFRLLQGHGRQTATTRSESTALYNRYVRLSVIIWKTPNKQRAGGSPSRNVQSKTSRNHPSHGMNHSANGRIVEKTLRTDEIPSLLIVARVVDEKSA